jgi:MtN3 and saliva related transmembrane protein
LGLKPKTWLNLVQANLFRPHISTSRDGSLLKHRTSRLASGTFSEPLELFDLAFALIFMRTAGNSTPAIYSHYYTLKWRHFMAAWLEGVGSVAAVCTTLCWLPQSVKIIREKRTEGISLITQCIFTFGTALWAVYGLLLNIRPVLYANLITLALSLTILVLKVRYA